MSDIVKIARSWIGTPYLHQASNKGAGCDCLGLIRGVWREAIGDEPTHVPAYTPDWSEPQREELLWRRAAQFLIEKPATAYSAGDVVLFRMAHRGVAKHLGIISASGPAIAFIHAYSGHCVLENPLSQPWARRIVACFEFPMEGR